MILDGLIASTVSEARMKAKFLNVILTCDGNQDPSAVCLFLNLSSEVFAYLQICLCPNAWTFDAKLSR